MKSFTFAIAFTLLLSPLHLTAQSASDDLQGAWRVAETEGGGPPGIEPGPPQPGLLLFAGDHYSYTYITRPRPELAQGRVSASEIVAVWNPVTANAGTFEISGDTMTRRPVVAKSPNAMGPGIFNEYTFRLSADTLWITSVGTETGPDLTPATVRYERVR